MQYSNDSPYLEGDKDEMRSRGLCARKSNVQLRASRTVSRTDSIKPELLQMVAFRNIEAGGQRYIDYGEKFMF